MATDYYPDVGEADSKANPEADTPEEDTEDVGETALLPKSILAGKNFKPGDEVVLKIVHLYDDEVEVRYSSEPSKESESDSGMSASDEIDQMAMPMMKG